MAFKRYVIQLEKLFSNFASSIVKYDKSPPVGQIMFDSDRQIFSLHSELISTFNIPYCKIASISELQLFEIIAEQLKSPEKFLDKIYGIYKQIELKTQGTIELKNGGYFWYKIEPEYNQHMEAIGRICLYYSLSYSDYVIYNTIEKTAKYFNIDYG